MKALISYFILACLLSWITWLPLYGYAFGLGPLPSLGLQHAVGGLGPLAASLICTRLYDGQEGLKQLFKQCISFRPIIYLAIALFSPFVLASIAALINGLINQSAVSLEGLFSYPEFPGLNLFGYFVYNLVFFGFGEEAGWRGFALPRLQQRFSGLYASIMLSIFWALWHWPLFLYRPGYTSMDMAGIAGWFFSLLTGSILLSWLFNSSRGSILICAVFHACIDIPFTADLADKNIMNYLGFLITLWGIISIFILKKQKMFIPETNYFQSAPAAQKNRNA